MKQPDGSGNTYLFCNTHEAVSEHTKLNRINLVRPDLNLLRIQQLNDEMLIQDSCLTRRVQDNGLRSINCHGWPLDFATLWKFRDVVNLGINPALLLEINLANALSLRRVNVWRLRQTLKLCEWRR